MAVLTLNVNEMTDRHPSLAFLDRSDGHRVAYILRAGRSPGLVWLGGFRSDMTGTKAEALDAFAARTRQAYLRFDYFAHGRSSGAFEDATIGRWREDSLAAFDALTQGPQIVIGSSLGGWMALMLSEARPDRVAGLVLIAPAPDFTERLLLPTLGPEARLAIERDGMCLMPSPEGTYPLTKRMIDDGRSHCLLHRQIDYRGPVRILQGLEDESVPWQHALTTADALASTDLTVSLVKGGDHRLSSSVDINRLEATIASLDGTVRGVQR